jgi:hypothetical protein
MNAAPEVVSVLRKLRRRHAAQIFARALGRGVLAAAGLFTVLFSLDYWLRSRPPLIGVDGTIILCVGALVYALLASVRAAPSISGMAERLDRLARTHDRLTTALAFSDAAPTAMQQMAHRECAAYLASRNFRPLLPWRLPREWLWLSVPLIAVALLQWNLRLTRQARAQLAAQAQEKTSPTVEALRALARELENSARKTDDPELKKLAEEIARRAEALRQTPDPNLAERARLSQLSALEQLAQELQTQRKKALSDEELHALADALQQAEATRKAAEEMKAGNNPAAADELERTAKKAEAEGEGSDAANAENALRQALDRLAQQQQLSSNALRQLTPGQQSALQRLADALRQMPPSQGAKQKRQQSQGSQQSLNNLLTALQNMKFGEGKPGPQSPDGQDQPGSQVMQIAPSTAENKSSQSVDLPGASPNAGEKDTGTTDTPFGKDQEHAKKSADVALSGNQAEKGPSYSQALPGGLDVSRSSREYKRLYDALAPEAESAVVQEDIPLGSRLFIKRYFESIRPTQ